MGVDKPAGWTSQDIVGWVRNHFAIKKVGHTGTLDPMATGVVILCLGKYTRLSSFVVESRKRYRAVVRLGMTTDTFDADGQIQNRSMDIPEHFDAIAGVCARFVGEINQVPPMYSAVRIGGQRLYKLARKGVEVERPARQVKIYALSIVTYTPPLLHLDVSCSKGTYIRTLADDIGKMVGCGAHLATLRRTGVGAVDIASCLTLQDLKRREKTGKLIDAVIASESVLVRLPSVGLTPQQIAPFLHGNSQPNQTEGVSGIVRVLDSQNILLGIGQLEAGILKPQRVIQSR